MRKYALLITLFLIVISMIGCSTATKSDQNKVNENQQVKASEETEQEKQDKEEAVKEYSIDKIVIPVQTEGWPDDIIVYRDFNNAVIEEMAKANDIPVETKELATFDDMIIALKRGDIDVIPGIDNLVETDLTKTYTYFTDALYLPNGEEFQPKTSYTMAVETDNEELLNFFNDMILSFNESGKMVELQNEYLGDRN